MFLRPFKYFLVFFLLVTAVLPSSAQRTYASHSVLATGNWYRFAVGQEGIYKIDLAFLGQLGAPATGLSSNSVRVFGNGGRMLPENPGKAVADDLQELALWVEDGGDGVLNGSDYLLLYAPGPQEWIHDSLNRGFRHRKNLYSDQSYYYLTIGGQGQRINVVPALTGIPDQQVNAYDFRYFQELDTLNFLSSGQQWLGEEFSNQPGKPLSRTFPIKVPGVLPQTAVLKTSLVSRSIGQPSQFQVAVNSTTLGQVVLNPVSSGSFDLFAQTAESVFSLIPANPSLQVQLTYAPGSVGAQGWLDWLELHARSKLSMEGQEQVFFRDLNSVNAGKIAQYILSGASSVYQVWDVTNPSVPQSISFSLAGSELKFLQETSRLHEMVAFTKSGFKVPVPLGILPNQDLHGSKPAPMIVVTHPSLLAQAHRLAAFHEQKDGLKSLVLTTTDIYHEFASGSPDPTALRNFLKMQYDRTAGDTTQRPRYLLLFGDASFDYKGRLQPADNLVPTYESPSSLDPLTTYVSDDYFGFLDDGDDINNPTPPMLDLGIGRLPASNLEEAKAMVDKIIAYGQPAALGPWRNEITLVADDEDNNLHLQDAELLSQTIHATAPVFLTNKFYLDAYQQQSDPSGSRYPELNLALQNKFTQGNLIWNYAGHGGFRRLAEEVVLDQESINALNNANRLPLFVTATCDVAPFDNPLIASIGEDLLVRPKTGAIALMVTTRLVFAYSNRIMNNNYMQTALQKGADGLYPTLGDAVRRAKNLTYLTNSDVVNNRKFTLLGDPALRLAFPRYQVSSTQINGKPFGSDTLKALGSYTIGGEVRDEQGVLLNNFNGEVVATVYDKQQSRTTLGNDAGSPVVGFLDRQHILFKGRSTVKNGKFQFTWVMPRDIDYRFGPGLISYYASNGREDGQGDSNAPVVGGSGPESFDKTGPEIQAYLNDRAFVNGSITNERPNLLLDLFDSSGINVTGTGIGHQLLAILDGNEARPFVLNSYYESELDNFRKGGVSYQLPLMEKGQHQLTIRAWDAANNVSEKSLEFRVERSEALQLEQVLNYPNPFTTHTSFWFNHNRPAESLQVSVDIYTITGKRVNSLNHTIISEGNRSMEVNWDGRDEFGSRLGRGVYLYRLRVRTTDGKQAEAWQKLFIL